MHYEGPKRFGRFIKKDSHILNKVSLQEFSFDEIRTSATIAPDNSRKSVIHVPYHPDDELAEAVQPARTLQRDLQAPHLKRPVLTPLNFSREDSFHKSGGGGRNQDDEDFDYEDAMAYAKAQREARRRVATSPDNADANEDFIAENAPREGASTTISGENNGKSLDAANTPSGNPEALNRESMEIAGKAINQLGQKLDHDTELSSPIRIIPKGEKKSGSVEDFIPTAPGSPSSPEPFDPEARPREIYKSRIEEQKIDQTEILLQIEEKMAKGYEDGFKVGEEKAALQMRQDTRESLERLQDAIKSFTNLQDQMLQSVQDNFYIVCQALAEALIKREFSISPETFTTVVEKAIAESMEPGRVKVRIHPETYDRIATLGQPQLLESLVKDQQVAPNDFKLDGQMSVVDVNISKLIAQLLQQADLNLFETEEKAG